ncbi:MAG TPA: hypothetical protein VMB79_11325 [Jatrophihabitans sp.]|nr:hypothetical protein [Jatrophihabitans sp.]
MRTKHGSAAGRLALIATVLVPVVLAGCRGSSHPATSSSAPAPSASSSTPSAAEIAAQVSQVWTDFFAGTTAAAAKVKLLQNGAAYAAVIAAQAGSPTARATTAKVLKVTPTADGQSAAVSYDILVNKQVALPNQLGGAVLVGGSWKVAAASFCSLLALEGTKPAACQATASPSASG